MAVMTGTAYLEKQQFLDNFWADWKPILGKGHVIKDLTKCDFTPIYEWHMAERERKKALPKEVWFYFQEPLETVLKLSAYKSHMLKSLRALSLSAKYRWLILPVVGLSVS